MLVEVFYWSDFILKCNEGHVLYIEAKGEDETSKKEAYDIIETYSLGVPQLLAKRLD